MQAISAQSKQYIQVTVTSSSDPTTVPVSFAFLGPYSDSQAAAGAVVTSGTTFSSGSWVGAAPNTTNAYICECLVGPGGTVVLTSGTYALYVKITGSPEVPVLRSGYLEVA